ncbi:MAG: type II toxin-antitoxin system prevent-host-death family antitoxin [Verrucomicrobiota bacterium]
MDTKLSVTEGSRNFSDLVNRIVYRGETAVLTRGGREVVRLTPIHSLSVTGEALAKKIRSRQTHLAADEAELFANELTRIRSAGNRAEKDPWAE